MTTRKPHTDTSDTDAETTETVSDDAQKTETPTDPAPDLTNVTTPADPPTTPTGIEGNTGDPIDVDPDDKHPFGTLKALGNTKPDVIVTSVRNGHGTWSWTARATEDGREIGHSGPHTVHRLNQDLILLFSGTNNVIALHATGLDKPRRLA